MDANFDNFDEEQYYEQEMFEEQAFKNLHDILNHLYNFANHYYTEMQKAQELCKEKADIITDLKEQLADEHDKAETRLKETYQAKDAELYAQKKEFEKELAAQVENFNEELAKSREHNEKLTALLQNVYSDLKAKKEALNEKEETLNEKERQIKIASDTLVTASANLDDERMAFYQDKDTYSDTERLKKLSEGYDTELEELTQENRRLQTQLAYKEEEINKLKEENKRLQTIVENADAEYAAIYVADKKPSSNLSADDSDDDLNVGSIQPVNFDNKSADAVKDSRD